MRIAAFALILPAFLASVATAVDPPLHSAAADTASADTSPEEPLARQLLTLEAKRTDIARQNQEDPRIKDLGARILEVRTALAYRFHQSNGQDSEVSRPALAPSPVYPRIVPETPQNSGDPTVSDNDAVVDSMDFQTTNPENDIVSQQNIIARARLMQPVSLTVSKEPLGAILDSIARQSKSNFSTNWPVLQTAGIDQSTPVSINLREVPAYRAIKSVLSEVGGDTAHLAYTVDEGVVAVSTADDLSSSRYQSVRVFNVRDLVTISTPIYFSGRAEAPYQYRADALIDTIKSAVSPDSWRDNGGIVGGIRELNGLLIVNQTADNQLAIASLLAKLRGH